MLVQTGMIKSYSILFLFQTLTFVSLIVCGDEIVMWLGACVGLEISISVGEETY